MMTALFAKLAGFFLAHKADIAAKMAASAGYDLLKKSLNFKPLIEKLKGFFKREEDAEKFVEQICDKKVDENADPIAIMKQDFSQMTGNAMPENLVYVFRTWFTENENAIAQMNTVNVEQSSGFVIGSQQAKGNIFNVNGDYNINEPKEEN